MPSFNSVQLIGNLTRDPELRYTQGGKALSTVGVAINEKYKSGDEWKDKVVYVDVTCWGSLAEVLEKYVSKGDPVMFQGRLNYEAWEKDGQKRTKVSVTAEKLVLLGNKRSENDTSNESAMAGAGAGGEERPF